jgi:hypothetical protein
MTGPLLSLTDNGLDLMQIVKGCNGVHFWPFSVGRKRSSENALIPELFEVGSCP